ncbi:MAG: response regulator transcription factor [Dermatophilaceae bacterium]
MSFGATTHVPRAPYRLTLVGSPRRGTTTAVPRRARPSTISTRPTSALSAREAQVMERIASGMRNLDIAEDLGVTGKTVRNHVNRIFAKLGVRDRVEAVLAWQASEAAVS